MDKFTKIMIVMSFFCGLLFGFNTAYILFDQMIFKPERVEVTRTIKKRIRVRPATREETNELTIGNGND